MSVYGVIGEEDLHMGGWRWPYQGFGVCVKSKRGQAVELEDIIEKEVQGVAKEQDTDETK